MVYYYYICLLAGGLASILSGLAVARKSMRKQANYVWLFLSLASVVWSSGYYSMISAPDKEIAWISNWVLHVAATFIPTLYLHHILSLTEQADKYRKYLKAAYISTFFFLLVNPTTLFVDDVRPKYIFNFVCNAGPLYLLFALHYIVWPLLAIRILIQALRQATGIAAQQLKYMLVASIGLIGGGSVFFLTFNLNIPPYTIILYPAYPLIVGYAMINYRLMDVRLVARKYFVIAAYVASLGSFYFITRHIASHIVPARYMALFDAVIFTAAILSSSRIKRYFYVKANKHFFTSLYDVKTVIGEVSEHIRSTIDADRVYYGTYKIIKNHMHQSGFSIWLYSSDGSRYKIAFNRGFDVKKCCSKPCSMAVYTNFSLSSRPILLDDEKQVYSQLNKKTTDLMHALGAALLVPLNYKGKNIGIMLLGEKESGDIYNQEDLTVLHIVSSQLSSAIENARLYEEVAEFNRTLQDKVADQTREITAKAEHLEKLMAMRSEFLDITSHQLRTPVSVIKGVLSMLREKTVPKAKVNEFLDAAFQKAIKLGEIINDILRASEMDTTAFQIKPRPFDLLPGIRRIVDEKLPLAESKHLRLNVQVPERLPIVMSDERYVEHAVTNLVNNAIQYTTEGTITLSTETTSDHVIIRVADTGIGIPQADRKKLFTKFGRAANAIETYTDGSGLGLFIIKKVVDATPGAKIEIEKSAENVGTTFALSLPIAQEQSPA